MSKIVPQGAQLKKFHLLPKSSKQKIIQKLNLELQAKGHCKTWHCTGNHGNNHSAS